jgi:hypothetical protein
MRRRLILASPLLAAAGTPDVTGFWFAEYGDANTRIQEIAQRISGGRWRAEIRIFTDCTEAERFAAEGSWSQDGAVLTHTMRRRGNWLVSPRTFTYLVLEAGEDSLRLRAQDGTVIEAQRVGRAFRFPEPGCGVPRRT